MTGDKKTVVCNKGNLMKTKKLMMVALVSSTLALSGCGAMSTAIKKRNLEVKTQMSETIWLEPASERTVFLQIKNTSDKDMSGLQGKIADAVKAKGYQVVTSPDKAYYWIQANVLKADKMDLRESQGWLNRGYEGAAVGAALGAGITGYNSSSAGATLGVGLAAGLVGMAADAMVEDVNYTMITDVQITGEMNESERASFLSTLNKMAEKKKNTGKEMFVGVTRVLSDDESKVFFEKIKARHPEMDIKIPFLTVMETLQYKPAESAASVQCPVLVVIAGQDSVNPPEQGRALYDAVASGTKELYEEADACHYDIYEGAFFERVVAVQTQWFKQYL